jgi:hypothetical protein
MQSDIIIIIGQYATALLAILGLFALVFNFFYKKLVKIINELSRDRDIKLKEDIIKVINDKTYPIQPNSNGGKSLSDVHKKIQLLEKKLDGLEAAHIEILSILTTPKKRGRPPKKEEL